MELTVAGEKYRILRLLGHGKGGYTYLAEKDGRRVALKQIHHEPCAYYSFGNKIEAEKRDYERLLGAGIPVPRMLALDTENERIVKELIDGPTVMELVRMGYDTESLIPQAEMMAAKAKAAGLNIDYYPTNFMLSEGRLWYVDYECNEYMDEWSFANWGRQYWTPAPEDRARAREERVFENPRLLPFQEAAGRLPLNENDIADAEARLRRFAPFIERHFPETAPLCGIIESPLREIPAMRAYLNLHAGAGIEGRLFLKMDSDLPIAGSVKARGGIYEVLKHSEELALSAGLLGDDFTVFDTAEARAFFSRYAVHVGSTGNLGLSIGIMSAALGYRAFVHMSADARQWKKDLLRAHGVTVIEYASDYSAAVREGRKMASEDPCAYFVDDENSRDLFLGYSGAARRLKAQLQALRIPVDEDHPLFVYIPCGVGGAPCGITFGLKEEFGDGVHCVFQEPVEAPCMLLGLASGLHDQISVQDFGLSGRTEADGLAVGRPSRFAGKAVEELVTGIVTVKDSRLYDYLRALYGTEGIFIEPSAAASFQGPVKLREMKETLGRFSEEQLRNACHIVWATGGSMVPEEERKKFLGLSEAPEML